MSLESIINTQNAVFSSYAFWSSVLIVKILLMSILTSVARFRTKTFANPEDLKSNKLKVRFGEESVERIRRAHRNDLENILPLLAVGFLYTLTNPAEMLAVNLFRAASIARLLHTFVYAIVILPQPSRALSFLVPLLSTVYMAVATIQHFW